MIRTLIADDHRIFRECLARLLRDEGDFEVAAEASTAIETAALLGTHRVDLILLDLSMPGGEGIALIQTIKEMQPAAKILVVTMSCDVFDCAHALRAGADGYLTKENAAVDLVVAMRQILRGIRYVCPAVAEKLAMGYNNNSVGHGAHERLSEREFTVFQMLVAGMRSAEIASKLAVSEQTVSTHKAHVLQKLDLHSNIDLVRYAIRNGLIAN
jgi:DNA-binding NarL/FixJ family response regulator